MSWEDFGIEIRANESVQHSITGTRGGKILNYYTIFLTGKINKEYLNV